MLNSQIQPTCKAQCRHSAAALGAYWILAALPLLKCIGGLIVGRGQGSDLTEVHLFLQTWLGRQLFKHGIPLWDPLTLCGFPGVGDLRLAALHPFSLLHLLLPAHWVLNVGMCMSCALAATFMFLLARQLGASLLGSWLAGLSYGFSGFMVGWGWLRGDYNLVLCYPWVPAVLCAAVCYFRGRRPGALAAGALAWAIMLVSGSLSMVAMVGALYFVTACAILAFGRRARARNALASVGMLFAGAIIALPHLYPALHWLQQSAERIRVQDVTSFPFDRFLPEHLMMLITPRLFGDESNSIYWGRLSYPGNVAYVGIASLLLGIVSPLLNRKHRGLSALLVGTSVIGLLAAADIIPLFAWLDFIPGWVQAFSSPSRFLFLFTIAISLAAAFGWDGLTQIRAENLRRAGIVIGVGVVAAAFALWAMLAREGTEGYIWQQLVSNLVNHPFSAVPPSVRGQLVSTPGAMKIMFAFATTSAVTALSLLSATAALLYFGWNHEGRLRQASGWFICFLFFADLPAFFHSETMLAPGTRLLPDAVKKSLADNPPEYRCFPPADASSDLVPLLADRSALWSKTSFVDSRLAQIIRLHERQPFQYTRFIRPSRLSPLMDFMSVRQLFGPADTLFRDERLSTPTIAGGLGFYKNAYAMGRANLFHHAEVADAQTAPLRVTALDFQPTHTVYMEQIPAGLLQEATTTTQLVLLHEDAHSATWTTSGTQPLAAAALAVVGDVYDNWWHAYLEESAADTGRGTQIEILRANHAFRALLLPKGAHIFRFEYEPPYWREVLIVSICTLLTCLATFAVAPFWPRRKASQ